MKLRLTLALVLFTTLAVCVSPAQEDPGAAARSARWNMSLFAVGGSGVKQDTDIQMFGAGVRVGRVLMHQAGTGPFRGTLEWNAEVLPVYPFSESGEWTYTAGVNPLLLKWNFTAGKRVVPFFELIGGTLFHSHDFPIKDSSQVNFNTGFGVGFRTFTRHRRSIDVDIRALHISNASLGNHNPGVNASVQCTVGYTWWK